MITKTRTKNSDLKELLGIENIPKSSDFNKQKLIQLAKARQSRPLYKTKLGSALSAYTCESSVPESVLVLIPVPPVTTSVPLQNNMEKLGNSE